MRANRAEDNEPYRPDYRLTEAYTEATLLTEEGIESLCPSYLELSEASTRYQDESPIGKGGIKDVYRAYDSHTRRWIAIARLRDKRGPEFYDHFVHEAWLTSSLSHPNIINVYDVGIDSRGEPFFTMDLKGNQTLSDLVTNLGPAQIKPLLEVFVKVCDAIAYSHAQEIIHLDLKPENIQAENFGEVLVCDWGLGKHLGDLPDDPTPATPTVSVDNMTLHGEVKGSPGYMAPEQIHPEATKDHRADIFSLGCILHFILTGKPPFTGETSDVLDATSACQITPPSKRYPELPIPRSVEAVFIQATAKEPDDRYQSVAALKNDIQRYLDGFATEAENPNFFKEARLFAVRNRVPVAITFFAFFLLSALSTLLVQKIDRHRKAASAHQERANRFESKAEKATTLYQEELSRAKEEQITLAEKLSLSANSLKNLGIFQQPKRTVDQASQLARTALSLDPSSSRANYELHSLNLIMLNFRAADRIPVTDTFNNPNYELLPREFPNFNFNSQRRPSVATLQNFLQRSQEVDPNLGPLMERMIAFDHRVRQNKKDYHLIVEALLNYLNTSDQDITLEYRESNSALTLRANRSIRLKSGPGGSLSCVLRYRPSRALTLHIDGNFDFSYLENLPIKTLDLSGCQTLSCNHPVELPSIASIRIRTDQVPPATLRSWIITPGDFNIVTNKTE